MATRFGRWQGKQWALRWVVPLSMAVLQPQSAQGEPFAPRRPRPATLGQTNDLRANGAPDGTGTHRTGHALPAKPTLQWRRNLQGPLHAGVAADHRGAVVVASADQLIQLEPDGSEAWRVRLGSAPASAPIITTEGLRVIITTAGEVLAIRPSGQEAWRIKTPGTMQNVVAALPDAAGGLVVAGDSAILAIARGGHPQVRTTLDAPVATLLGNGIQWTAIDTTGAVYQWLPPADPRHVATLPTRAGWSALWGGSSLLALIHGRSWITLNLANGRQQLLAEESPPVAHKQFVLGWDLRVRSVATGGPPFCRAFGKPTCERDASAGLGATTPGPYGPAAASASNGPPPLVDRSGKMAFAQPLAPLQISDPGGEISTAEGVLCSEPLTLAATGARNLILTCRAGSVWKVVDTSPSPEPR